MPRFFLKGSHQGSSQITIVGADVHHIRNVLRLQAGDCLTLCDEQACEFHVEIMACSAQAIQTKVLTSKAAASEPALRYKLYQALPKGDKMERLIQQAVELGVAEVQPFTCARCEVHLDPSKVGRKIERYQKIAHAAAKQCGRALIPPVAPPLSFKELLVDLSTTTTAFVAWEAEKQSDLFSFLQQLPHVRPGYTIAFVIGPEGGFDPWEIEQLKQQKVATISLGSLILRTETAALFVLSSLRCLENYLLLRQL